MILISIFSFVLELPLFFSPKVPFLFFQASIYMSPYFSLTALRYALDTTEIFLIDAQTYPFKCDTRLPYTGVYVYRV